MFCQKCGQHNQQMAKFCSQCGNGMTVTTGRAFTYGAVSEPMTFGRAITTCFAKYAEFKGRATRSEYWWFTLFTTLMYIVAAVIDPTEVFGNILGLVFFLPTWAVGARRLHDVGRSGWWQLLPITIIGIIPLLIWLCSKGDSLRNDYGQPV